ncbi:MAG: hypothetical protein J6V66_00825, partial [Clostridia bacterium]|nr:hypothetical protein [Clostridia bacterium]
MSGVDGAVKFNSLHAPSVKNTETEKSVSAFAVEKTVEEFVKELIERTVDDFIKVEENGKVITKELPDKQVEETVIEHQEIVEETAVEQQEETVEETVNDKEDLLVEDETPFIPSVEILEISPQPLKLKKGKKVDFSESSELGSESLKRMNANLNHVYEDENILLVNKPQGISVHEDEVSKSNTLI